MFFSQPGRKKADDGGEVVDVFQVKHVGSRSEQLLVETVKIHNKRCSNITNGVSHELMFEYIINKA